MNEEQSPRETWPDPPKSAAKTQQDSSLRIGIGIAWLIIVIGTPLMLMAIAALSTTDKLHGLPMFWVAMVIPPLAAVLFAMYLVAHDKSRMALGIFFGLASVAAVALLLVAACFGLFSL